MINWILDEIKNRQTYDLGVSGGIMTIDSKKTYQEYYHGNDTRSVFRSYA